MGGRPPEAWPRPDKTCRRPATLAAGATHPGGTHPHTQRVAQRSTLRSEVAVAQPCATHRTPHPVVTAAAAAAEAPILARRVGEAGARELPGRPTSPRRSTASLTGRVGEAGKQSGTHQQHKVGWTPVEAQAQVRGTTTPSRPTEPNPPRHSARPRVTRGTPTKGHPRGTMGVGEHRWVEVGRRHSSSSSSRGKGSTATRRRTSPTHREARRWGEAVPWTTPNRCNTLRPLAAAAVAVGQWEEAWGAATHGTAAAAAEEEEQAEGGSTVLRRPTLDATGANQWATPEQWMWILASAAAAAEEEEAPNTKACHKAVGMAADRRTAAVAVGEVRMGWTAEVPRWIKGSSTDRSGSTKALASPLGVGRSRVAAIRSSSSSRQRWHRMGRATWKHC